MRSFDETLHFVSDLQAAQTVDAVCRKLLNLTSLYGLDRIVAGTIPDAGLPPEEQKAHLLLHSWPTDWLNHYVQQDYVACDPLVTAMKDNPAPITWREAVRRAPSCTRSSAMISEASAFDLNDGLCLPMVTLEGVLIAVSLGGRALDITPREIGTLQLASHYAVTRAMQLAELTRNQQKRPELTARERECIRWAALGKSEWEISQILGISEHTSEKHLLSAKSKLGAVNRVQAVAEAIRLGYIT